jgi:hypothetical protein
MPRPVGVSRRAALGALAAAGVGTACRATSVERAPASSLDALAERYVRLTLELAQHQPSLVEQWLGPAQWRPGARRPVSSVRSELDGLREALARERTADAVRLEYLRGQLDALNVAARRLSGESLSFADEAREAFGPDVAAFVSSGDQGGPHEDLEAARMELERRLPGRGALPERCRAYRVRHAIPAARQAPLVHAALEQCRTRVQTQFDLPPTEQVHVESEGEAGLEGRARYDGRFRTRVWIAPGSIDLARLLWLVAHESYPGHHVQHVLADREIVAARGWSERLLFPSFGRHLLCAEGAAEAGAALLMERGDFAEICSILAKRADLQADDVDDLVAVHRAVTSLDVGIVAIARAYLDGTRTSEATATALRDRALVVDPFPLLQAIERQRTRILAYPCGRRLVGRRLDGVPVASTWTRFAEIATTLTLGETRVTATATSGHANWLTLNARRG